MGSYILVYSRLYVYFKEFKLIIGYYVMLIMGFIFGYFVACLMMITKGNTKTDLDYRIGQEDDGEY